MSVFLALLLALRHCARSRDILQLEILALRHPGAGASTDTVSARAAQPNRPLALGVAFARVGRLAIRTRHRETGDSHRLAPVVPAKNSVPWWPH
jgi:hypothetical protein